MGKGKTGDAKDYMEDHESAEVQDVSILGMICDIH